MIHQTLQSRHQNQTLPAIRHDPAIITSLVASPLRQNSHFLFVLMHSMLVLCRQEWRPGRHRISWSPMAELSNIDPNYSR
ncbi:hypothetical protein EB796_010195 [Bugula neritina]|uniref:Uncharacterized protein n=1 Tax=Bugula neritina TaxID=10212 RepID=A0A7J7JZY5_BUGNE|nr:hypothetical protein EB796_010195 [Bugula neritina]